MSAAAMTDAEATAISYAREDFVRQPSGINAAALLESAYDAWNESHLSERDFAAEVIFVAGRLREARS